MTWFYPGSVGCGLASVVALLSPHMASWALSCDQVFQPPLAVACLLLPLGKPRVGVWEFL